MLLQKLYIQNNFSDIEIEIANFILENGDSVCSMSIQELATKTFSSPSSLIRLCKKLNTEGFKDFKLKLKEEFLNQKIKNPIKNMNFPFFQEDSYKDVAEKLLQVTEQSIYTTKSLFDYNSISKIVNQMKRAEIFDIYGQGTSQACAYEFKNKMIRLGKCVHLEAGLAEQINQAINSNEKHFAIVISHSGENKETLKTVHALNKTKTPVLAITQENGNSIANCCQYNIYTGANETKFLTSKLETYSSYISTQYTLDCLYSFIYLSDFDKYFDKTKRNEYILRETP